MQINNRTLTLKRLFRYFLYALCALLVALVIFILIYWFSAKSNFSGTIISGNLNQNVQIQFDENDIPHIKAKTQRAVSPKSWVSAQCQLIVFSEP
jgi:penicillin amidase